MEVLVESYNRLYAFLNRNPRLTFDIFSVFVLMTFMYYCF